MAAGEISIKYEGGDADRHEVDMRQLGVSLQGFDRLIGEGVALYINGRPLKKRERAPLVVRARESQAGSHEVSAILADYGWVLPIMSEYISDNFMQYVKNFISFVLSYLGGRRGDAEMYLEALVEIEKISSSERIKSQEMWMSHMAGFRDQLFDLVRRLAPHAEFAVAPVGHSVSSAAFGINVGDSIKVDEPMADAIRSKAAMDVSDLFCIRLKLDGYQLQKKRLHVFHPDDTSKPFNADVRDPAFDEAPNPYTDAAANKSTVELMVKTARREGVLEKIYVMSFVRVVNEPR